VTDLRCPLCGDLMEVVAGEVTCRRGDMGLSQVMRSELEEIVRSPPSRPEAASIHWGGKWHCPLDGERMVEDGGRVQCPACERYLPGRVLYQLIELHPHKKVWR
jgi:uncharacterized Zn finger protein (UPF0148 family)